MKRVLLRAWEILIWKKNVTIAEVHIIGWVDVGTIAQE
jgi:hypothetical protein